MLNLFIQWYNRRLATNREAIRKAAWKRTFEDIETWRNSLGEE
jgi:hypothetical protein